MTNRRGGSSAPIHRHIYRAIMSFSFMDDYGIWTIRIHRCWCDNEFTAPSKSSPWSLT